MTTPSKVTIEVVKGGFILDYPILREECTAPIWAREVFVSQRKLNQKLKEVIESLGLVDEK